jgi:AAA domain
MNADPDAPAPFEFVRACDLAIRPPGEAWLVEGLWSEQAVGIVGGEPKCGKSFLALDLAVAVASGTNVLRRFPVKTPGPVLVYAAEDALPIVRERLEGIARAAGMTLATLDIHVITEAALRLDTPRDRERLHDTVAMVQPRLLVLDPFVRLHRIDENVASEVVPILASLRELQRAHQTAVVLVHHSRKGAGRMRAGQALRGSSELHAWGDSNLYLRRKDDLLHLSIEHRAAPTPEPLVLELREDPELALRVIDQRPSEHATSSTADPNERILEALAEAREPLTQRVLRERCGMRTATLGRRLAQLTDQQRIVRKQGGFALAISDVPSP